MTNITHNKDIDILITEFLSKWAWSMLASPQEMIKEWEDFKSSSLAGREGDKNWEILEFQRTDESQSIYQRQVGGRYKNLTSNGFGWTEDELLNSSLSYSVKSGGSIIKSVKRLSDNSVWAVGDKIVWDWVQSERDHFIIEGFNIDGTPTLMVKVNASCEQNFNYISKLGLRKYAPKAPSAPPIGIMPEWLWKEKRFKDLDDAISRYAEVNKGCPEEWLTEHFALKNEIQAREENKFQNKPILSFREVMNIVATIRDYSKGHDNKSYLNEKLRELAIKKQEGK